ncbi:prolyl oligopeptidase family serine peptidase [Jatrophihabitans fulvus]
MLPADIAKLVTLGPPTLSPDGARAVVAVTRPDLDADEYRSSLWLVATDGSDVRRLTHGDHDSAPEWSPDGRLIAFLRKGSRDKPQLHVLNAGGGDARELTDLPGGAGAPRWSPDSTRVAFAVRVPADGRYGTGEDAQGEKIPPEKEPPRRITGLQYRTDNVGFVLDRRHHVFVVDVTADEPEARQITEGEWDDTAPAWSPDGSRIAFVSRRHDDRETDWVHDVFTVSPDGGEATRVSDGTRWLDAPAWLDDTTLVTTGVEMGVSGWVANNEGLFRVAGGSVERLTDAETVHIVGAPVVTDDGVLAPAENRGAVELLQWSAGGLTTVSGGHRTVQGVAHEGGTTVVTYADPATAGELARVDGDRVVPLTSFATDGLVRPLDDFTATAADGTELHGFVVTPEGDGPHPVLLMIHGGPFAAYGWTLLDEAQVYARAGYAVVYTNPRGSSGYGQAYGSYIVGDVGEKSAADLLALLDAALERPDLDADRVGVLGGSHGGFMTTWLVGHTDRFRAAVSERAVNAIDSFEGSSDIGWEFADALYGTDPEQRRRQSPFTYAEHIGTPLLIVHSEHDWRCPVEQAQRLYVSLRKRGATVEFLLFPGEGHELSRSGLPSHRVARFDAILDWFGRYV